LDGLSVRVRGTVQGVGFRPFVYGLAARHRLTGWVRNTTGAVEIELDGPEDALARFLADLRRDAPPLARIDRVETVARRPSGFRSFEILESRADGDWQPVAPDAATCDACLDEIFDPEGRRYRYPFTNCTHCGPRFTIIEDLPYDRGRTTMRAFPMCDECRREYEDPWDRRFHAQPVACPECGPRVWLHLPEAAVPPGDPIERCAELLRDGMIVALRGLGGFQLACDASNPEAVAGLRDRKRRWGKPFALMVTDQEAARRLCYMGPAERAALSSRERPVVLLRRLPGADLAPDVAPGLDTLGLMLPYTPLHHLLLHDFGGPLVMTSGNLSDEPIAIGNWEALERLAGIADAFLLHDREIYARYDDSVVRELGDSITSIRRARGYAPAALELPFTADRAILACGAQQKSTFCLVKGSKAFLSPHIGDLESVETLERFRDSLVLYRRLFRVEPEVVAHDLHPDYLATQFALDYPVDSGVRVGVQHHHAHLVAGMVEHGLHGPVIGVAYDGTGYGSDGAIWGGEVMVADWTSFHRVGHLRYAPLLSGESAIRRPTRMAISYIWSLLPEAEGEFDAFLRSFTPEELTVLRRLHDTGFNAPPTSSCGRLFDAVAALLGLRSEAIYEGQPAVELEALADGRVETVYPWAVVREGERRIVDPGPTILALWRDARSGRSLPEVAGAFHNTVAAFTAALCEGAREDTGLERVVLSGGCFQSALLTRRVKEALGRAGFEVYTHERVPPNDGGLALGQAVVAHAVAGGSGSSRT
jgi:hydrogenase maturation protein HypF